MHQMTPGRRWPVLAIALLALFLALTMPSTSPARTVLDLDTVRQPVDLADWGDFWVDPHAQATMQSVDAGTGVNWTPTHSGAVYNLQPRQALWVRFTIPPAPDAERWYLEIPYASVDRVSLYSQDTAGQWNVLEAGDRIAVGNWPVPHRHPLLPVTVSAEEPRKYLLRVENMHAFGAPLMFISESRLNRSEQRVSLILGIFFGLAGLAVAISVLSAVSLRDSAYALYAPAVALTGLTQASLTGIAGLHLWPHLPAWNDASALLLPVWTMAAIVLFISAVVSLPERSRRAHLAMQGLGALGAVASVLVLATQGPARMGIMAGYMGLTQAAVIVACLWAWRLGDRYAPWVLVGGIPVILSALFPLARIAGLVPVSFLTSHSMQFGIAVELPILLVILMLRSQQRRENSRRIQGLDRVDPATGLINAHVFEERLAHMIARSVRLRQQSSVLLMDIINTEQIQRDFDRRSAEEMPLRVAGRLLTTAREIDSVARLGELRFGMLVEGPLSPQDAASAGARVIARCLMPFKDKSPEWVAQLRVAQALVPLDGSDVNDLMQRLHAVLANAPRDSRRGVFALSDAPGTGAGSGFAPSGRAPL